MARRREAFTRMGFVAGLQGIPGETCHEAAQIVQCRGFVTGWKERQGWSFQDWSRMAWHEDRKRSLGWSSWQKCGGIREKDVTRHTNRTMQGLRGSIEGDSGRNMSRDSSNRTMQGLRDRDGRNGRNGRNGRAGLFRIGREGHGTKTENVHSDGLRGRNAEESGRNMARGTPNRTMQGLRGSIEGDFGRNMSRGTPIVQCKGFVTGMEGTVGTAGLVSSGLVENGMARKREAFTRMGFVAEMRRNPGETCHEALKSYNAEAS